MIVRRALRLRDEDQFKAFWSEKELVLTATEFELLRALMGRAGKVYRRDELIDQAYGGEVIVSDRTVDSHVREAAAKAGRTVGADPIETDARRLDIGSMPAGSAFDEAAAAAVDRAGRAQPALALPARSPR